MTRRRWLVLAGLVLVLGVVAAGLIAAPVERFGLKVEKVARGAGLTDEDPLHARFRRGVLAGARAEQPTVLQFGPDDRLYVAQQNGLIRAYSIVRHEPGRYRVTATETISLIRQLPNHNDGGRPEPGVRDRQVTGLFVAGTATSPVLFVTSSDPRHGAGYDDKGDLGLDTNSGVVSRLTRTASGWRRLDLVRGLPRSEETHSTNGVVLSQDGNLLYVSQGGNTNAGAPSHKFGDLPQYALAAAVLELDLTRIGEQTYDLPTLDDPARPGVEDAGDPFGGNDGRNQARLDPAGPVTLFATGLRNPYDLVLTETARLFTIDNGGNPDWGGKPAVSQDGSCANTPAEGGSGTRDALHLVRRGAYLGHPNPTRGECTWLAPGRENGALVTFKESTNGLVEYRASSLRGELRGDLLAVSWDNSLYRLDIAPDGRSAKRSRIAADLPALPLDVTAQPDDAVFPGTIWVAGYGGGEILVLEPEDYGLGRWELRRPSGPKRQEVSYVAYDGRLYLAGGGTIHEAYDPATNTWSEVTPLPASVDHIQGVVLGGRIYYVGGLSSWPEPAVDTVLVYDPETDRFERAPPMPRARGAGGVAAYRGKLYYLGGLYEGSAVAWVDSFDPATGRWEQLADMPRVRDHFQAAVTGNKLYAIGGRAVDIDATTDAVDVYDLGRNEWRQGLTPLPTPRGGFAVAVHGDEILVIGGEGDGKTYDTVEAYETMADTWRQLAPLRSARHGISAAVCGEGIYVAAGGREQGGGAPTDVHEVFFLGAGERAC